MIEHIRVREPAICAAQLLRHAGMQLCVTAHMHAGFSSWRCQVARTRRHRGRRNIGDDGRYAYVPDFAFAEFKEMVARLHDAGIEVILDVVYNHTAEGNQLGPTPARNPKAQRLT